MAGASGQQWQPSNPVPAKVHDQRSSLGLELLVSGMSVSGATCCTNPLDVIKTRLQLQQRSLSKGPSSLVGTGAALVREEGLLSLWKGLSPAVARGFVYGGMRLGLYGPCKDLVALLAAPPPLHAPTASTSRAAGSGNSSARGSGGDSSPAAASGGAASFLHKAAAGTLSGGLAAALTSPTELVKTRLQAQGSTARGPLEVVRAVVAQEGVAGLWRGAVPGLVRAALLTASQCATYDEVKRALSSRMALADGLHLHLVASMITGLVTTTVANPADVVKTHMFVGGRAQGSMLGTALSVLRANGPMGFMSGWAANYARLGPQTVLIFLINEQLRQALDMRAF